MNRPYSSSNADHSKDGFTIKYVVGNYKHSVKFADQTATEAIGNIADFFVGSGFSSRCVSEALREAADRIDSTILSST
jgi:hypothetical protein